MAQSKAVRDRQNRKSNEVRGTEVVGGVQIDATEYVTGNCNIRIETVPCMNARQAAHAFGY